MKPVCLISGAGGRLGGALCADLADDYHVVGAYREKPPQFPSQLLKRLSPDAWAASVRARKNDASGTEIFCIQANLFAREDIRRLIETVVARYGQVDAIVNCAADTTFHGKLLEIWQSEDYAARQLEVNCIAPIQLVSAVHDICWKDWPDENAMFNRSVVNVSSMSGLYAFPCSGQGFYSASKAALNLLTLHLSLELAPYSVRANAICPARFSTSEQISKVVSMIRRLLAGDSTGEIVSE
jgi:NAD(P)-dependent dehydrogenase (short-subunit alcohol dehydrogenase family)